MTQKIVVNRCFGGFGLSHKAVLRYAELKGIVLYPVHRAASLGDGYSYYIVPKAEYDRVLKLDEEKRDYTDSNNLCLTEYTISRDDPALVQTVQELKKKADGWAASLEVVEIPDDVKWTIHEYDGSETVEEVHRSW